MKNLLYNYFIGVVSGKVDFGLKVSLKNISSKLNAQIMALQMITGQRSSPMP
jgi:hypothetical protein